MKRKQTYMPKLPGIGSVSFKENINNCVLYKLNTHSWNPSTSKLYNIYEEHIEKIANYKKNATTYWIEIVFSRTFGASEPIQINDNIIFVNDVDPFEKIPFENYENDSFIVGGFSFSFVYIRAVLETSSSSPQRYRRQYPDVLNEYLNIDNNRNIAINEMKRVINENKEYLTELIFDEYTKQTQKRRLPRITKTGKIIGLYSSISKSASSFDDLSGNFLVFNPSNVGEWVEGISYGLKNNNIITDDDVPFFSLTMNGPVSVPAGVFWLPILSVYGITLESDDIYMPIPLKQFYSYGGRYNNEYKINQTTPYPPTVDFFNDEIAYEISGEYEIPMWYTIKTGVWLE